jgi:hypothetical protein
VVVHRQDLDVQVPAGKILRPVHDIVHGFARFGQRQVVILDAGTAPGIDQVVEAGPRDALLLEQVNDGVRSS